MAKIKLKVKFGKSIFNSSWQDKTFADFDSAIIWCRRNSDKIFCINDFRTFGKPISHWDVMAAIGGLSN